MISVARRAVSSACTLALDVRPCPTQWGRRNALADPAALLERYKTLCVPKDRAAKMTAEELAGKVVVGRFK